MTTPTLPRAHCCLYLHAVDAIRIDTWLFCIWPLHHALYCVPVCPCCCCIRDPAYAGSTPRAIWQVKCCYSWQPDTLRPSYGQGQKLPKTVWLNVSFRTVHWTWSFMPAQLLEPLFVLYGKKQECPENRITVGLLGTDKTETDIATSHMSAFMNKLSPVQTHKPLWGWRGALNHQLDCNLDRQCSRQEPLMSQRFRKPTLNH